MLKKQSGQSKIFRLLSDILSVQPVRYLISSAAAFVVDYTLLLILEKVFSGLSFAMELAAVLAFCCSSQINFHLNRLWVFRSDKSVFAEMGGYYALAAVSFAVKTFVLMELMCRVMSAPTFLAKPIAEAIMFAVNFAVQKKLIFFKKK